MDSAFVCWGSGRRSSSFPLPNPFSTAYAIRWWPDSGAPDFHWRQIGRTGVLPSRRSCRIAWPLWPCVHIIRSSAGQSLVAGDGVPVDG